MASGKGSGGMSLSMKLIRFLIVLFNLAFVIVGAILLAIGVYVVKDPKLQQLRPLLSTDVASAYSQGLSYIELFGIGIIVVGGVLLAIGFLGCCGAIKGFRFLHVLYAIIVGLVILAEVAVVIAFIAYQNQFRSQLVTKLRESIATYYVGTPLDNSTSVNSVSLSWDFTQFNLKCCGAISKNDFSSATHWNRSNPYQPETQLVVPFTCCPVNASGSWTQLPSSFSSANACATSGIDGYTQGCYDRLIDIISVYKKNFLIGLAVVGVVEILAFVFALTLYCRKSDYNTL